MLKTNPVGFKICSISESERAKFQAILDSPEQAVSIPDRLAALKHWFNGYGGSSSSTDADYSILFPSDDLSTAATSLVRSTDDPCQSTPGYRDVSTASPMRSHCFQIAELPETPVGTFLGSEIKTTAHEVTSPVNVFETAAAADDIEAASPTPTPVAAAAAVDAVMIDEVQGERLSLYAKADQQQLQHEEKSNGHTTSGSLELSILDDVALDIDESEELSWMVVEQISADGPLEQVAVSVNLHLTKHRDNQEPS